MSVWVRPFVTVVAITALVMPATSAAQAPPDSVGHAVYLRNYCGLCHAFEKAGTAGIFGPPHDKMSELADLRLNDPNYSGSATTPAQYIRESILEPTAFIVPGFETSVHRMPAYKHLSADEVDALVTFLLGDHHD